MGHFEKEHSRFEEEGLFEKEPEGAALLLLHLGLCSEYVGNYKRAAQVYEMRKTVQEKKLDITKGFDYIVTLDGLASSLLWSGAQEKAVEALEKCLAMKSEVEDRKHYSFTMTVTKRYVMVCSDLLFLFLCSLCLQLFELGVGYFVCEDREKAVDCLRECNEERKMHGLSDTGEYATCALLLWCLSDMRTEESLSDCKEKWETHGKQHTVRWLRKNMVSSFLHFIFMFPICFVLSRYPWV